MKAIFNTLAAFALALSLGVAVIAAPHSGHHGHGRLAESNGNVAGESAAAAKNTVDAATDTLHGRQHDSGHAYGYGGHNHHYNQDKQNEVEERTIGTRQSRGLLGALDGLSGSGGGVQSRQIRGLSEALGSRRGNAAGSLEVRQVGGSLPIVGSLLGGRREVRGALDAEKKKPLVGDPEDKRSENEGVKKRQAGLLGSLSSGTLETRQEKEVAGNA